MAQNKWKRGKDYPGGETQYSWWKGGRAIAHVTKRGNVWSLSFGGSNHGTFPTAKAAKADAEATQARMEARARRHRRNPCKARNPAKGKKIYKYKVVGPRGGKYLTSTMAEARALTKNGGTIKKLKKPRKG